MSTSNDTSSLNRDAVPSELKLAARWILVQRGEPFLAIGSFRHPASLTSAASWRDFPAALAAREKWAERPTLGWVALPGDSDEDLVTLRAAGVVVFPFGADSATIAESTMGDHADSAPFLPRTGEGSHEQH